jgi:hypothetical protein
MQPIERRNLGTKKQIAAYKRPKSVLMYVDEVFMQQQKLSGKINTDMGN